MSIKLEEGNSYEKRTFDKFIDFMKSLMVVITILGLIWQGTAKAVKLRDNVDDNTKKIELMANKSYVDNKIDNVNNRVDIIREDIRDLKVELRQSNKEMTELLRTLLRKR